MLKNSVDSKINESQNNFSNDSNNSNLGRLQKNLMVMGFEIVMINKIISIFNVQTEDEAIDYLIKNENGMWRHPFIPKGTFNNDESDINKGILSQPKIIMSKVISKIKSKDNNNSNKILSKSNNVELNQNYFINDNIEICEICGELKEFHIIKKYEKIDDNRKNSINNSFYNNNNLFTFEYVKEEKNILIDDDEELKYEYNNPTASKNNENLEIINDNENEKCQICLDELENPVRIELCNHKFCYDCFNQYLVNLITINNIEKIPCPYKNCFNKELREIFLRQYISTEEYSKYLRFKAKNKIEIDPQKIICPHCNSYAKIIDIDNYDPNNQEYVKAKLKCMNNHEFCSCGRPLHENNCYSDEKEFNEYIKKEKIKKCPKCGFFIKKNRGCNHMTCGNPNCKYQFCWLCLKEYHPDHYDYGDCQGLQFTDEDSFEFWLHHNCKYVRYVYLAFLFVLICIFLLVSFIFIPSIGLSIICEIIFFENDPDFNINILKKTTFTIDSVKNLNFLTYILLALSCQSVIYIVYAFFFFILWIAFIIIIPLLFLYIIIGIIKCLFEPNQNYNELLEIKEIELSDNIDNNNNSNNKK